MAPPASRTKGNRREAILDAGFRRFLHYGYQRTSMDDIATEAGISRPAVYTYFQNKEDVFRGLANRLHEQALADAKGAADAPGAAPVRIQAVLEAKLGSFFDIVQQSIHAQDLLGENSRLCGDITRDYHNKYIALLKAVITEGVRRGELNLAGAGVSPTVAAELLVAAAQGLERGELSLTPKNYRRRLGQLVRVVMSGLAGQPTKHPAHATGRSGSTRRGRST